MTTQMRASHKSKLIRECTLCTCLDKVTSTVAHNDIVRGYYDEVVVVAGLEAVSKKYNGKISSLFVHVVGQRCPLVLVPFYLNALLC